jgi:hypothetical protein
MVFLNRGTIISNQQDDDEITYMTADNIGRLKLYLNAAQGMVDHSWFQWSIFLESSKSIWHHSMFPAVYSLSQNSQEANQIIYINASDSYHVPKTSKVCICPCI